MSDSDSHVPAADALPIRREARLGFRVARVTAGPVYRVLFRLRFFGLEHIRGDRLTPPRTGQVPRSNPFRAGHLPRGR